MTNKIIIVEVGDSRIPRALELIVKALKEDFIWYQVKIVDLDKN